MNAMYALPTDKLSVTWTLATATADANYPVTNVGNNDPASAFLTSSSGPVCRLIGDLGSAQSVALVSLQGLNIPAGTDVRVQRNTSNSWPGVVDDALVIPPYGADGLPLAPWAHVTATPYRWISLLIPSLAQKIGIGEVGVWGAKRTDIRNVRYPVRSGEAQPSRTFRTAGGVKRTALIGHRPRWQPVEFRLRGTDHDAMLTLFRACRGQKHGFLWIRNPLVNDSFYATFDRDTWESELVGNTAADVALTIEEKGCGPALPTA